MSENSILEFDRNSIGLDLVPIAVQFVGIGTLLFLVYGEPALSIAAIIISSIWLKLSHSDMPQEYGELRTTRHLFGKLAGWMNQPGGADEYDHAASKFMMFDGSIEDAQYRQVVTAAGLANGLRGFASLIIHGYLIFTVVDYFWRSS